MTDEGPGVLAAVGALQALRQEWAMRELIAFWDTPNGRIALVVDEDGHQMFVNGQPVPQVRDEA